MRHHHTRGRVGRVAICLLALVALTACTSTDEAPSDNPYAADYAAALNLATSEFEREALRDGKISRAEYDEAHELWLACMDQTFPPGEQPLTNRLELTDSGFYNYVIDIPASAQESFDQDFYHEVFDSCSEGTITHIAALYSDAIMNPSGEPLNERIAACLVRVGFVDPGYTGEDVSRDYFTGEDGQALDLPPEVQQCLDEETS